MIVKKIKAKCCFTLGTTVESRKLLTDEVVIIKFKDELQFKDLLRFGHFVEADTNEPETRKIPTVGIRPMVSDHSVESREIRKPTKFSDDFILNDNLTNIERQER